MPELFGKWVSIEKLAKSETLFSRVGQHPAALFGEGTATRGGALLLEMALLLFVGERLHSLTGLLQAAALTFLGIG